jgi:hypothetical protein
LLLLGMFAAKKQMAVRAQESAATEPGAIESEPVPKP